MPALLADICIAQNGGAYAVEVQTQAAAPAAASAPATSKPSEVETDRQLKTISLTANRVGTTDLNRTAATVSVITREDIEENNAKDVKDALKYEPGVDVNRQGYRPTGISSGSGRGGNDGINIRGLEGNQVLMLEDGIPLPQTFSFGTGVAGRGDYLNTDFYERIEVLRGPASVLYGSDGLTGAVNFVTKDPSDLLAIYGKKTYFSVAADYDSTDHSSGGKATTAFRTDNDAIEGVVMLSGRHGGETQTAGDTGGTGSTRSEADPLTYNNRSALGKLVFRLSPTDRLKLTAETLENSLSSDGLSQVGYYTWSGYTTNSYYTTNKVTSHRVKLEWDHDDVTNPWVQHIKGSVFYRNAATDQTIDLTGTNSAGTEGTRTRVNHYGENIVGGSLVAESAFDMGTLRHRVTYGTDVSLSHYSTSSNGADNGVAISTTNGYLEEFPKTAQVNVGVYAQDEIRWNRLSFVPGLRFDYYHMSPQTDSAYTTAANNSTQPTTSSTGNSLSPRLALLYEISPALVPYAQYARGFRAPSAYQVNSYYGSSNSYYYQQVGNPDLKPETSNSFEVGLRGKFGLGSGSLRYSTAAFYGRYSNFISLQTIGGSITSSTNPLTYQYVNYAKATIKGVEAKADYLVNDNLEIKAGVAYIDGSETSNAGVTTGIESVPPLAAVLGVNYRMDDHWFVGADLTFNARRNASDISTSTTTYFSTPSYTILDLHAGYRITKHVNLTAGINNLFDRKYWRWSDVRDLTSSATYGNTVAMTAPGRTFNVGAKIDF